MKYIKNEIRIINSPLEFVIVGPKGEYRGILASSNNATLDLIGIAAINSSRNIDGKMNVESPISRLFFKPSDTYLCARTYPLSNIRYDDDFRLSDYVLWWKGQTTRRTFERIEKELSIRAVDIKYAIEENDTERLEWNIAPIIYLCESAKQSKLRTWRNNLILISITLTIYIITFISIFILK
jgi:hypothetical protein